MTHLIDLMIYKEAIVGCSKRRTNMTAWLYDFAKKHLYSSYQLDIRSEAFKRAFVTNGNAATTEMKRTLKTVDSDGRDTEERLKIDLERNVKLCLHSSFCRNRKITVDPLPCCKQRLEEQSCLRTASNGVRMPLICCKTPQPRMQSQCRRTTRSYE